MTHIISDIVATKKKYSIEEFEALVTNQEPPGFTEFQAFLPGDYEYQSALFRVRMASTSGDRGIINKLRVSVDVPDMFDRNIVEITSATWKQITYERPFHVPAVPVVTVMSSDDISVVARVDLASLTRYGFRVKLEKPNGTLTTGVITYAAQAY